MPKIITLLILFILTTVVNAQTNNEQIAVKKTIETFFDGLHKGDSTIVRSILHTTIKIQTTFTNKDGRKKLITDSKKKY